MHICIIGQSAANHLLSGWAQLPPCCFWFLLSNFFQSSIPKPHYYLLKFQENRIKQTNHSEASLLFNSDIEISRKSFQADHSGDDIKCTSTFQPLSFWNLSHHNGISPRSVPEKYVASQRDQPPGTQVNARDKFNGSRASPSCIAAAHHWPGRQPEHKNQIEYLNLKNMQMNLLGCP